MAVLGLGAGAGDGLKIENAFSIFFVVGDWIKVTLFLIELKLVLISAPPISAAITPVSPDSSCAAHLVGQSGFFFMPWFAIFTILAGVAFAAQ